MYGTGDPDHSTTGKNVAPQNIENLIKESPYLSQAMVYGDRQKFLTALLTLDAEAITEWAKQHSIKLSDNADEWPQHPEIQALAQAAIDVTNARVAQYETIKQWRLVPGDFTVENNMLTPTLKLRRRMIADQFASVLDEMYG